MVLYVSNILIMKPSETLFTFRKRKKEKTKINYSTVIRQWISFVFSAFCVPVGLFSNSSSFC